VAWLRALLSATWRLAEVPVEKAHLLHAICDRIRDPPVNREQPAAGL
jgi:hypothetical protein